MHRGRRYLVTGAGSGIGRAVAARLARDGARLALLGRDPNPLEETAGSCRAVGGDAFLVVADVADEAAVGRAVAEAGRRLGAFDGVVNNAGVVAYGPFASLPLAEWRRQLDVNLTGPFLVTRAAHPWLLAGEAPAVVMVASTLGLFGLAGASAYCAAKAGVVNLARALAVEWGPQRIRVNAVCPGVTDTPMVPRERQAELAALHPQGRIGRPEEVAEVVAGLLGPATSWVSGAVVPVDGAATAGFAK